MKSPIKGKPLRNPGQSLDKQIQDFFDNNVGPYLVAAGVAVILAVFEWLRWYNESPTNPLAFTILVVIVVGTAIYKTVVARRRFHALKQGRDGERAVGQYLEGLREIGVRVFHDVPGDGFNLDHVVIARSGIYVIETKTYNKPDRGEAKITFDGENIFLNGRKSDFNPIRPITAATNWLRHLLKESAGKDFHYRQVLIFTAGYST